MMLVLRVPLFFGLIWTLVSFGFSAGALTTLLGQESYISAGQMYTVVTLCAAAALCSLGLLASLVVDLLGKQLTSTVERFTISAMLTASLGFCGIAVYAFFVTPTDLQDDFLRRFAHGARFEFLLVGMAALVMGLTKRRVAVSS